MMENVQLTVNGSEIELKKFARNVTENIGLAVVNSLDLDENLKGPIVIILSNKELNIKINNVEIPTNEFATLMLVSIIESFVSNLSGFNPPIETVMIELS